MDRLKLIITFSSPWVREIYGVDCRVDDFPADVLILCDQTSAAFAVQSVDQVSVGRNVLFQVVVELFQTCLLCIDRNL
jgi:hypothetical protein